MEFGDCVNWKQGTVMPVFFLNKANVCAKRIRDKNFIRCCSKCDSSPSAHGFNSMRRFTLEKARARSFIFAVKQTFARNGLCRNWISNAAAEICSTITVMQGSLNGQTTGDMTEHTTSKQSCT